MDRHASLFTRRFFKNKGALPGLILIGTALLLALCAYLLAPDHSPNANRIVPEIGSRPPGFVIHMLLVNREEGQAPHSLVRRMISGEENAYYYIPVTSWQVRADSIAYLKFMDDGVTERGSVARQQCPANPITTEHFYLGTDKFGRDILSRLLIGTRISLEVGLIAVAISLSIGILLGAWAGFFGGWVDDVIMWGVNVIWSIPTLLLVFALTLVLGKGFWQVFIAVGLTMWVNVARLVRGQVIAVKELEYIEAARALGYSSYRIIFKHILPNIMGPVMVIAAANFASAIVIEAGLSFLGVGVQPPQPSWGLMIKENYNFIITHNPMLALAPGIAIMLLVLAFNLVGNALRDALNVRGKVS